MFATFAPMILWLAHTIAAFAPTIAAFALGIFSKTHQSSLTLKGGSTAFPKPLFSWRRLAALGNLKASFHCPHLHNLSPQGTGDVPTALLGAQTASL